jgi:GDP-4-dehydro-6-deoxy-D-mannose reductase
VELFGLARRLAAGLQGGGELSEQVTADLTVDEQACAAIRRVRPDWVFHLAAEASVARSWRDPAEILRANLASSINLLEALRHEAPAAKVLVAGSSEQYGPVPVDRLPADEREPPRPQNPYAVSKAAVDVLAGFYADAHGMHVVRTRAFNHAGPGQSTSYAVSTFARQIAEAERKAADGRVVVATGNIDVKRDFTDVRDVVRAYWLALERGEPGQPYNVCSGLATSIADILAGLARHTPLEIERRIDRARLRPHEVMEIRGSHDRLTSATGWQPEIPLAQTLRDTLDWWRGRVGAEVGE